MARITHHASRITASLAVIAGTYDPMPLSCTCARHVVLYSHILCVECDLRVFTIDDRGEGEHDTFTVVDDWVEGSTLCDGEIRLQMTVGLHRDMTTCT